MDYMFRVDDIKLKVPFTDEQKELKASLLRLFRIPEDGIRELKIIRRSLDARKKPDLYYVYSVAFDVSGDLRKKLLKAPVAKKALKPYQPVIYRFPEVAKLPQGEEKRPLIVGAGPAGLFCAYMLAKAGLRPILAERGEKIAERDKKVNAVFEGAEPDPESNVAFGEGGAGTFSDGKLFSQTSDREGLHTEVFRIFAEFGAPSQILYDAHPHIGTDVLKHVVTNLREETERLGGEFLFGTRFERPLIKDDRISGALLMKKGQLTERECAALVLCTGHSARDTFRALSECGIHMEPKAFAAGFRVQHEQAFIDRNQYGEGYESKKLPAAEYKLTAKSSSDRSVYSFCMCPGGYVINASSAPGELVVNGMSYHGRASGIANSAIVVSVGPEITGGGLFDGMLLQEKMERAAWAAAGGRIPLQCLGDFAAGRMEAAMRGVEPQIKGSVAYAPLNGILPEALEKDIIEAFEVFGRSIPSFDDPQTLLAAVESRTSSPLRIVRDEKGSGSVKGLFPCGEGAGYAGGITSAAVDGIRAAARVAEFISECILPRG